MAFYSNITFWTNPLNIFFNPLLILVNLGSVFRFVIIFVLSVVLFGTFALFVCAIIFSLGYLVAFFQYHFVNNCNCVTWFFYNDCRDDMGFLMVAHLLVICLF